MGGNIIVFSVITISLVLGFFAYKKLNKVIQKNNLNKYLKNITIDSINSLSGQEFEEFLYYLFLNLGFEVTKTKTSHDYGADLLLKINSITIAVQSKLYNNHSVGTSSVQEVYSSTKYYNAKTGIVITNSYFTKNAITLAKTTNIILWDRDKLIHLLKLKDTEKKLFKNELICNIIKER